MGIFGTMLMDRGRGVQKDLLSLKSVTHIQNDETCHSYTLPKEDPKNI